MKNQLSAAPSACDFRKVYLRSITCCNNCQEIFFLFQRFDIMFILSSSPKVGICSKRSNLHISSFLRFAFVNHCQTLQLTHRTYYQQIRWPHTSNILDIMFHWISAAYFWLQNFNKNFIKEINVLQIFVKEQCFEKKCFDNKTWKGFSLAMDRPMFLNMNKNHLGWLLTRNLIDVFSNVFND